MLRATHPGRRIGRRWILAFVTVVSLAACGDSGGPSAADDGPVTVEPVAGSDLAKVTLTAEAAKRIDLQTVAITQGSGAVTAMPYAALLYDPDGNTWAFVKESALSFRRAAITVEHIDGDTAFLTKGPQVGTEVATVGAVQLYGAEQGVGEDE